MYPIIADARLYDSFDNSYTDAHYLLYADSIADAAKIIANYCGDELDTVTFSYIAEAGTLFEVDSITANRIKKGEGRGTC